MKRSAPTGFTLIELLVVIAIIAVLAAILFPVFAQAREKARQASCLSNMKQQGLAVMMYAQDYDETLPPWWVPNPVVTTPAGWGAIYFAIKERWNRATRLALTAVVLIMVFLVGLARLVLHAHWPSDVLGGLLLGSSCAAFGAWWDARRSLV